MSWLVENQSRGNVHAMTCDGFTQTPPPCQDREEEKFHVKRGASPYGTPSERPDKSITTQVRRKHPLRLSISISKGKKNLQGFPNKGERIGNSLVYKSDDHVV